MRRLIRVLPPVFFAIAGSLLVAWGASLALAACTPGTTNYVDSEDTPAGGVLVNAGVITCGLSAGCDTNEGNIGCCSGPGATGGGVCVLDSGECPTGTGLMTCNETADCDVSPVNGALQPCCATVVQSGDGGVLSSECSSTTSCPSVASSPTLQLCRTNGECPNDKCVIQLCPDGLIYEMCGLSTSASFPCTLVPPDGG